MTEETPRQQFTRWLTDHRGLMLKIALSFTNDRNDLEDLLQEIAVALWKSVKQFKGECQESTWVYKVSLFTATAWCRTKRRRQEKNKSVETIASLNPSSENTDPRLDWLLETIRTLPVVDRTILLSCLEGYSQQEIAEFTGMTSTNVGVRVHRLKKQLSKLATEHFNDI